jgi:serine O-acetyltransferase
LSRAGSHAIAVYRVGVWRKRLPRPLRAPVTLLYYLGQLWVRNIYNIEIYSSARIGRRLIIPHGGTLIIAPRTVVGDDCILRHNVTLGRARSTDDAPVIGNRVAIATGAVILGSITIGDGVEIGPNAVVLTDVPEGATVFADPARIFTPPRRAWREEAASERTIEA